MLHKVTATVNNLWLDQKAVSATEYTLLIVGIAALVLGAAETLSGDLSPALGEIGGYLMSASAAL